VTSSFALVALLGAVLGLSQLARAADAAQSRIPILAWGGPPADQTSLERYRELAGAGFTHNYSGFASNDAMSKALDIAQKAGIKLMISTPELKADPRGTANRFKAHPANGGYYIRDEPGAKLFPELAAWVRKVQAVDEVHPCYVNLFPNYATPEQLESADYQAYLDNFVAGVPVPMLSFDHYPVIGADGGDARLRAEWYDNLERAAATAKKANRPMWAFVLSVAHTPYPKAELAHLRVQAFSDLAYGAQVIQYFTYWTLPSKQWNFHEGPIDPDGKRTATYDRVKQVNDEVHALARVFVGSQVLGIGHTGDAIPSSTRRYKAASPIAAVETEGDGAVVSSLANGRRRYLVIVNRDINHAMPLTVRIDNSVRVERIDEGAASTPIPVPVIQERVGPGNVFVLTWEAGE
jgi:hypothetical protein